MLPLVENYKTNKLNVLFVKVGNLEGFRLYGAFTRTLLRIMKNFD
jgi:hypothetical protein